MANCEYDIAKLSSPSGHTLLDARHLIEVRETLGKGLGIFSREKIPRGTRIVAESPLLKATAVSSHVVNVQAAFNNLPPPKQRAYLSLHGHASETLKKENDWESLPDLNRRVLAIYFANHWGRDVFWIASRFNHSCIPNIHNAYNPTIQKETFHSIRDIEPDEELTVSYVSGMCVRAERQAQLNKWGFQCKCPACQDTPDGNKIEQQLTRLAMLRQELEMAAPVSLPSKKNLDTHRKMAALMHSTGLVGKYLNNCYLDAALCSAIMGNVQMAMLWTEKEVEVDGYCLGQDHPDYQKEVGVLRQLRSAAKSKKPFHYTHIKWVLDWDEGPD
ncbi:TPR domain protein [Lentithecium fluviatile CBS 122367]|uniref:TPR domain protein n=1 Tax=Lentithecium fluviatile CBS 122367 TaxID=1168545 RepID=A0A6G1J7T2_9PLEO|nr:TPR domain protein [Lentithecium fluviatile CBS 122367]